MRRILNVLTHPRTLSIIGLLALAAVLFVGADTLQIDLMWPAIALGVVIALWLLVWAVRRLRARRANRKLGDRQWAVGRFSIAYIHLFRVYWRFRPGTNVPPGAYPALEAHHERMLARPAVQKALAVEKTYE